MGEIGVKAAATDTSGVLTREVLRTQAKDVLLQRILDGFYAPGARLIETQIARELGISQGSIREALRELESVGLVDYAPFRGCTVREPTRAEMVQALPVRAALESLAASTAVSRLTKADFEQLERLIDSMQDAADRGDRHGQSVANAQFHALIVHAAGNAVLERLWQLLEPAARTYLTVAYIDVDLVVLAQRHWPVLESLRTGDPDRAARAIHDHLMEAARWLASANEAHH
jgi:DNA-binding GntR family transcriptional regulator